MPIVEEILTAESASDRQRELLGDRREQSARIVVPAAAADQHKRMLRCDEPLGDGGDLCGIGRRRNGIHTRHIDALCAR